MNGKVTSVPCFYRRLKEEGEANYIFSFAEDVNGQNPARAFHGSFGGTVTVKVIPLQGGATYLDVVVKIHDNMSAISGTRLPPFLGGYDHSGTGECSILPENPDGADGAFRTIQIDYKLHIGGDDVYKYYLR